MGITFFLLALHPSHIMSYVYDYSYFSYLWHQFLSIQYWSNSEYWSQKRTQSGNIHPTELDDYVVKQSGQNLSFISFQLLSPLTTC